MSTVLACAPAIVEGANVAVDEPEARPLRLAQRRADLVEIALVSGGEVVEADDLLLQGEQCLQEVRADETGDSRDEPPPGRGAQP